MAARKHYSLDVLVALYTVPMLWIVYDRYYPDTLPREFVSFILAEGPEPQRCISPEKPSPSARDIQLTSITPASNRRRDATAPRKFSFMEDKKEVTDFQARESLNTDKYLRDASRESLFRDVPNSRPDERLTISSDRISSTNSNLLRI